MPCESCLHFCYKRDSANSRATPLSFRPISLNLTEYRYQKLFGATYHVV